MFPSGKAYSALADARYTPTAAFTASICNLQSISGTRTCSVTSSLKASSRACSNESARTRRSWKNKTWPVALCGRRPKQRILRKLFAPDGGLTLEDEKKDRHGCENLADSL